MSLSYWHVSCSQLPACSLGVAKQAVGDFGTLTVGVWRPFDAFFGLGEGRNNLTGVWVMRQKDGFTLIELMIVITIIAIIAAIALPSLLRARIQSNEAAAVGNLRAVATGQISYHGAKGNYGDFNDLLSKTPPWVDGTWADGAVKSGYVYTMPLIEANAFAVNADPQEVNMTGVKHFFVNASGVIRWNIGGPADENSEPIPNP